MRRNFAQILESGKVDYKKEYKKLYSLLFDKHPDNYGHAYSVYNIFNDLFASFYFHGTSLSLQEFDEEHGFHFPHPSKENLEIEDLILLMEYFYNMLVGYLSSQNISSYSSIKLLFIHVSNCGFIILALVIAIVVANVKVVKNVKQVLLQSRIYLT